MKAQSFLDPSQRDAIEAAAAELLLKAEAAGQLPTPVADVIGAAGLKVRSEISLNADFLSGLYGGLAGPVKQAIDKVLGVLDARGGLIYLDQDLHHRKKSFLSLHELAHGYLPWQRDMWAFLEDSDQELDLDVQDQLEHEANYFAGEVLFQGSLFSRRSLDLPLELASIPKLASRFGSSFYAAARRYVDRHPRTAALAVFDGRPRKGRLRLRRAIHSHRFRQRFGKDYWEDAYGARGFFAQRRPRPGEFAAPLELRLRGRDGRLRDCRAEAFNSGYQIFYLICPKKETSGTSAERAAAEG